MPLYKSAKSRIWQYDFQHKGRRYHGSTGCTSRRDAEAVEAERRREVALDLPTKRKHSITLDDACGAWYQAKGQYLRTADDALYQLDNLATIIGRNVAIGDITLMMVDSFIARRRATVSNASVNRETALLRRVVNWCGERGYEVPDFTWRSVKLKERAVMTRVLSYDEEARLMLALPESLRPIVRYALLSGQRRSEIVGLRWSDVDFPNARVTTWVKGGQRHSYPLTPELIAIIANQPKVAAQVFTYKAERSAPSRKDRPARIHGQRYPFSSQGWERKFKKALAKAGIEDFRFHDLRHTALSRLKSVESANKLAGHSDMETTMRYVHIAEADVRESMIASESQNNHRPVKPAYAQLIKKVANDG